VFLAQQAQLPHLSASTLAANTARPLYLNVNSGWRARNFDDCAGMPQRGWMHTLRKRRGNSGYRVASFGKSPSGGDFVEPAAGGATIPLTSITD
jgi:hypothetical protein